MAFDRKSNPFRECLRLLEKERVAILSGNFETLERIGHRKAELARQMMAASDRPEASETVEIRDLARRNQMLLEAAGEGIKAALARLGELRNAGRGGQTYRQDGSRTEIGRRSTQHDQRA